MRKTMIISIIALLSVILVYGFAGAAQVCSSCHTMHNSQNDAPMNFDANATPNAMLLRGTCMGCHSDATTNTIKTPTTGVTVPQVFNTGGGTTDPGTSNSVVGATVNLAGGNFYYVDNGPDDPKGHNVDVIGVAADGTLGNTPPGYEASHDTSSVNYNDTGRLTCAGSNGCHGNRDIDTSAGGAALSMSALDGAHHEDDTTINGGTVGHSFRFLKGILGREDTNWQQSASASDHNEYEGDTTQTATTTISYLCGQCHGVFHDQILSGGSWVRHPTDTDVISQGGEYASYNDAVGGNAYSIEAPVAYDGDGTSGGISTVRSTVSTGDSIVMCLSCHRAHASPNDDILRWSYATIQAGGSGATGTGCFRCHTTKDTP